MLRDEGAPGTPPHLELRTGFWNVETSGGSCWSDVIDPCVICRRRRVGVHAPVTGLHGKNVGCADDPVSRRSCSASRPMPHCMSANEIGAAG